ncbi:MAG: NapC/NirT family cytochrome c [Bacteroidales bacterium]|nr:NapC/NirT family cytochrome c [Bacteroidales bacterium]
MKLPRSYYNLLSFIGTTIAGISLFMILYLFAVSFFFERTSSYLGLFIYIIVPVFMVFGLILIPLGMSIEIRKRKKKGKEYLQKAWPVIDLNISRYRNAIIIFSIGSLFFLFLTGVGSYEAFHYTESVEFCGKLCHEVMEPEYVAYQNSSHSRVACVDCHVGSGADWYMRSKLSGLRQVYAVLTDNFSRPIETPVKDLRPARETCEECHWPLKFYERRLRHSKHYLTDSLNTELNISMQMKIGPTHSALGLTEGIHWHINPDVKIEYISRNDDRENIPWVKYTNLADKTVTIYEDIREPLKQVNIESSVTREMDCIDCHNRPSHHYLTPQEFVDNAIASGVIPQDLPFIKKIAMDLFIEPFERSDTALVVIENHINEFYKSYNSLNKELLTNKIDNAINGLQEGFSTNIFPEMGVSWDEYPDHIGHKTYNGCFRCHSDNHVSKEGQTISKDCNLCHTIVMQGRVGEESIAFVNDSLEFIHPVDIEGVWKEELCMECHRYLY